MDGYGGGGSGIGSSLKTISPRNGEEDAVKGHKSLNCRLCAALRAFTHYNRGFCAAAGNGTLCSETGPNYYGIMIGMQGVRAGCCCCCTRVW